MILIGWKLLVICYVCTACVHSEVLITKEELHEKFKTAKEQLTDFYKKSLGQEGINLKISMLWEKSFDGLYPGIEFPSVIPYVVNFENQTLLLSGLDLWSIEQEQLSKVSSISRHYPEIVKLVKGFEWQGKRFLLICMTNNQCELFTTSSIFDFSRYQTISDIGTPIDAHFFVQHHNLFLTVLFKSLSGTISHVRIYRWRSTYFDKELIPEITSTALSITVFGYNEDIIMVLSCSGDNQLKFPSQVWCRKVTGEMIKVQYLPTVRPLSITHFTEKGKDYILVIEEENHSAVIYYWHGSEFVKWVSMDGLLKYFKVSVSKARYTTLILTNGNSLIAYFVSSTKLYKVFEAHEFLNKDTPQDIVILSTVMYEENGNTYMFVNYKVEDQFYMSLLQVHVLFTEQSDESDGLPRNTQHQRFVDLEPLNYIFDSIKAMETEIQTLNAHLNTLLFSNKETTINSTAITVSGSVDIQKGEIWNVTNMHSTNAQLMKYISSNNIALREEVDTYSKSLQAAQQHKSKHIVYMGDVHIQQAKINSLSTYTVNSSKYEPGSFLSLTNNQRVQIVKAKAMKVKWLVLKTIGKKTMGDNLLEELTIRGNVRLPHLESENLWISEHAKINNAVVRDLLNNPVIIDKGTTSNKSFQLVSDRDQRPKGVTKLKLQDSTLIKNLYVDQIDHININNLINSLVVKDIRNVVYGDLSFKNGLLVNQLVPRKLFNPKEISFDDDDDLQTLQLSPVQNQSQFDPNTPYYVQLNPNAQQEQIFNPNIYYVPVHHFPVRRRERRDSVNKKNSVVIIKNKVKILGNLKVEKLFFENSSLAASNQSVPTGNLDQIFWTYSSKQVIPGPVHFNQGVSLLLGLGNQTVNGKHIPPHGIERATPQCLVFENIHINGDIRANNFKCDILEVNHLHVDDINGQSMQNIVQLDHLYQHGINITTENINIEGNMRADLINEIDVQKKFESTVFIDKDFKLNKIFFTNISAKNAEVEFINSQAADLLSPGNHCENKNVTIDGDLHISQLQNVSFVNGMPANLTLVVNKSKPTVIHGRKNFATQVSTLNHINVTNINGMNIEKLLKSLLRKSTDQIVEGFFTIRSASLKSLIDVDEINGVKTSTFLYINEPILNFTDDLRFTSILVEGYLTVPNVLDNCILPKVEQQSVVINSSEWFSVWVTGDSEWPSNGGSWLQRLMGSALTTYGDQTLTGNVVFNHMFSDNVQIQSLNDKNITFIFEDTLSKTKKNQVISGKKQFLSSLKCDSIKVKGDATIPSINNININDINARFVPKTLEDYSTAKIISGHKTFTSGLKVFMLNCSEGINGIAVEHLARDNSRRVLPPLTVDTLVVMGSLQVDTINDLSMDKFLEECIFLRSSHSQLISGLFHVRGDITLQGNATVSNINSISNSDLVFLESGRNPVTIKGCKTFSKNITFETNSNIDIVNENDLSEIYKLSLKRSENVTIYGTVEILSDVELDTIYGEEYIVGSKQLTHLNNTFNP